MVCILLENGFELCEALAPVDILRRGGVDIKTVGVSGKTVNASAGVPVTADISLSDVDIKTAEMLIIPGGQPGVDNLWANADVRALIEDANACGIPISAICAAPMILARLGILNGKTAVCYPSCAEELSCADYKKGVGVAHDGRIITGRAAGDAYDFAFEILKTLKGESCAASVKASVCYE